MRVTPGPVLGSRRSCAARMRTKHPLGGAMGAPLSDSGALVPSNSLDARKMACSESMAK